MPLSPLKAFSVVLRKNVIPTLLLFLLFTITACDQKGQWVKDTPVDKAKIDKIESDYKKRKAALDAKHEAEKKAILKTEEHKYGQ